jgi:crotonobetainyl-CoA:carnitine CoA-transferase CaiB-like acyl-CoA transferase
MHDVTLGAMLNILGPTLAENRQPIVAHERTTGGAAFYRPYETRDGRYLVLAGQEPKFINNLLGALGRPELAELCLRGPGPHQQPVVDFLSKKFRQKSLMEWNGYLETLDVCFGRVNTLPEALDHQNLDARKMIRRDELGRRHIAPPIHFREEPASPVLREPLLGEHTETIFDVKPKAFGG